MRRFLVLLLLGGCAAPGPAEPPPLEVGVAETDVTPSMPYGLAGYYHERKSTDVRDPLHSKAIVLRQGREAVALAVCDVESVSPELTAEVRKRAGAITGLAPDRIIVAATHTHTGPAYQSDLRQWLKEGGTGSDGYAPRLVRGVVDSIVRADAGRAAAGLRAANGVQETPISFCRRFVMRDGSVKTWASYRDPETVREAGPIDPDVAVLCVAGPDRTRAALVNFALHPDTLGGTRWSADFAFDLGAALRARLGEGATAIFANGCCGDINHVDPRSEKRNSTEFIGRSLGRTACGALGSLRELRPALAVGRAVVRAPLQEATDRDLAWARAFLEKEKSGQKFDFLDQVKAHKLLALERLRGHGPDLSLEVHAIRLSPDAALVTLPGEAFVELGLAIKRASPFRTTFVIELANTSETGYIPTREACPLGGYEVVNSTLAPGGGEMLRDAAIRLLEDLR